MKKLFWITSLSLGLAWSATAATYRSETYTSGFENGGNIPNGEDSLWSDLRTVSGITEAIAEMKTRKPGWFQPPTAGQPVRTSTGSAVTPPVRPRRNCVSVRTAPRTPNCVPVWTPVPRRVDLSLLRSTS